ncbi:hypothetical protein ACEQ8H_001555 [Pleosporales sp. CAS-2024a]
MGIPIGWNVAREHAKQKDVLRADVTGQRSPIRRRTRPTPSQVLTSATRFSPRPEPPVSRSSQTRTRLPPPPVPEVSRSAYRASDASRDPPSLQREDAGFRRLQSRIDRHARAIETRASAHTDRPLPALTPGFAPAAAALAPGVPDEWQPELQLLDRMNRRRLEMMRSHGLVLPVPPEPTAGDRAEPVQDEPDSRDNNPVGFPPLRRMGRRTIADGPLPMSSLRESWSPAFTVDGLGDRERSFSPDADDRSQWETFYDGIVPDTVAPTAESSFASAAASASFSNSHPSSRAGSANTSASSSRTHLTVPSRRHSPALVEQFMRACDTSDDDTAEDTEAEEEAPAADATRQRYNPIALRRRSRPSYFSDEPPHRDTERYSRQVMERTRDASAYVHGFYASGSDAVARSMRRSVRGVTSSPNRSLLTQEHVTDGPRTEQPDGPVDGPLPAGDDEVPHLIPINSPALDEELREARSLLERLSRNRHVSDDFWASIGLTRSFADRVESFNEREQL